MTRFSTGIDIVVHSTHGRERTFISAPLHPLNINHIVGKIFTFVDPFTIKSCRLVSKTWKCEATSEMLSKNYIRSPRDFIYTSKERQEELKLALSQLVAYSYSSNSRIIKPLNAHLLRFWDEDIFGNIPNFYHRLTTIHCTIGFGMENLYKILVNATNLQVLDTKLLCLSVDQPWLNWGDNNLNILLQKLRSLKEINLHFDLTADIIKELAIYKEYLQPASEIYINGAHSMAVYIDAKLEWRIKRLHLHFTDISRQLSRYYLTKLSNSLTCLNMIFFYTRISQIKFDPWRDDDSHIPLNLVHLETLDYMTNALTSNDPALWRTLITALQLPKLKKLIIRKELAKDFDGIVDNWNSQETDDDDENGKGKNKELKSESIEEVIVCLSTTSIKAMSLELWPKLKRFGIRLDRYHPSTANNIRAIFFNMRQQLEELTLQLTCTRPLTTLENPASWNEIITGYYYYSTDGEEMNDDNQKEEKFRSIRDLKYLKSLTIQSCCNEEDCFTDEIVYRALIHMDHLQSLRIGGKNISTKALNCLRQALGWTVHIEEL